MGTRPPSCRRPSTRGGWGGNGAGNGDGDGDGGGRLIFLLFGGWGDFLKVFLGDGDGDEDGDNYGEGDSFS